MIKKRMNIDRYAEKLLSFRPRSQFEIEQKLRFKKYPEKEIKDLIKKLKKEKLINDRLFADLWVSNRENLNPKGRRLLELELRQKGISKEIIESVLSEYSPDLQIDLALKRIESKIKNKRELTDYKAKQKLLAYLARHGFDYGTSKKALEIFVEDDKL